MNARPVAALAALLLAALPAACAAPPVVAPGADPLLVWLQTSDTAAAIATVADEQGWLQASLISASDGAAVPGDLDDLRAIMGATATLDTAELEAQLRPVARSGDVRALLGALRQRRPGTTRGDLAHWVAVSLIAFSSAEPVVELIPQSERWDPKYVADVLDLRASAERGTLANVARPALFDAAPPPLNLLVRPRYSFPYRMSTEDQVAWPVVENLPRAPADAIAMKGTLALQKGDRLQAEEIMVIVHEAGRVRVLEDLTRTVAFNRLTVSGDLDVESTGNLNLRADQTLFTLTDADERGRILVWLGEERVADVPASCCRTEQAVDATPWIKLSDGPLAGGWTHVPGPEFRKLTLDEFMAARQASREFDPDRRDRFPELGALYTMRSGRPEIGGAHLIYWRDGAPTGRPVFVLHGFPGLGSAYLRAPIADTLGKDAEIFFYDQRGSGYSSSGEGSWGLTLGRASQDLNALRGRAGLDRIDVAAHGFGSFVALRFALDFPDRIRSLILIEPEPATYDEWLTATETFESRIPLADREKIARYDGTGSSVEVATAILGLRMRGYTADPDAASALDFLLTDHVLGHWQSTRDALRADLGRWNLLADFAAVRAPVLVLAGEVSPLRPAAERIAATIPDAELAIIPDTSHFPFLENPAAFQEAIETFGRGSPAAPREGETREVGQESKGAWPSRQSAAH